MARVACPRCEQEWLECVVIIATGEEIVACQECDATWAVDEERLLANMRDYQTYLGSLGLTGHLQEEINRLGYLDDAS